MPIYRVEPITTEVQLTVGDSSATMMTAYVFGGILYAPRCRVDVCGVQSCPCGHVRSILFSTLESTLCIDLTAEPRVNRLNNGKEVKPNQVLT